jgi:cyclopropane-fatty-acyl-phospholipid synthase
VLNLQSRARAFQVGEAHYDIGNDLYRRMLDTRMTYTCAYWGAGAKTLEEAQRDKLELICRKLKLEPGMRVLDIGCGWGSFCRYAAENHGVECVGLTVSREQMRLGNEHCADLPVEIRLQDYRDVDEKFDRVLSVGMFEHVGPKNYRTYMRVTRHGLKPGGLAFLHTIGGNQTRRTPDGFITRYIFPNGHLPSLAQIGNAMEGMFVAEDLHNFGRDYDRTLMAWHERVNAAWPELEEKNNRYDKRFQRMWRYYLLSCAGAFRARKLQVWQWVLSTGEQAERYQRVAGRPGEDGEFI